MPDRHSACLITSCDLGAHPARTCDGLIEVVECMQSDLHASKPSVRSYAKQLDVAAQVRCMPCLQACCLGGSLGFMCCVSGVHEYSKYVVM
jgi:hypothetical protein